MRALRARLLEDRCEGDDGAALVLVVLVLFTLIAFAAIALDTAALVQERRELQNGADAAAMAVAQRCAGPSGCGSNVTGFADGFADANAADRRAAIGSLCGRGISGVAECSPQPPGVPAGANYVKVTTRTETANGSSKVPFNFARIFGADGQGVSRSATVLWGGPKTRRTLPITFSECEYNWSTGDGEVFASPVPSPGNWPGRPVVEQEIFLKGSGGEDPCENWGPGGDAPGGFGWLRPASSRDCFVDTDLAVEAPASTGNSPPNGCSNGDFEPLIGTVIPVPVFLEVRGSGSSIRYELEGYAAFYLTGYFLGGQFQEASLRTGDLPCGGNERCISGYFVKDQIIPDGTVGGPSMGFTTFQYIQ